MIFAVSIKLDGDKIYKSERFSLKSDEFDKTETLDSSLLYDFTISQVGGRITALRPYIRPYKMRS
jgi:hypothetical protein